MPFISKFFTSKTRSFFSVILILTVIFFSVRSCFSLLITPRATVYRIARDATWYPLNLYGKEKNMLGFSDELLLTIGRKKNLHIQLIVSPPKNLREMLELDNAEGILTSMNPDIILKERYLFSDPYYNLGAVLIVRENSNIQNFEDLRDKYLGISRSSSVLFSLSDRPFMYVVPYDSLIGALDDLVRDKIDAVIMNQINAYNFMTGYYKEKLRVATAPLTHEGLRLVTFNKPEFKYLIETFNEGLEELKKDGTYQELLKKWDLFDPYVLQE